MTYRYMRYEVVPIEEIVPIIREYWNNSESRIQRPKGYWVGVTSLRLKTFCRAAESPEGMKCVTCGLEATHFAVEASPGAVSTHLNLYGLKDGKEILFTHDHILCRALGGADDLSNAQIMCSPCNGFKSKEESKEVQRRRQLVKE